MKKFDLYHWGMIITALILGAWVLASPLVIADASASPVSWSFRIAGTLTVLLSVVALIRSDDLPEYGLMAIAAWLIVSPWVLDLAPTVTRQSVFYGAVLAGLAWLGRPSFKPKAATD